MNKLKLKEILGFFYKTSTVNAIIRGDRKPSYNIILKLEESYDIPFTAWKDIKSFLKSSIANEQNKNEYLK